MTKQVGCESGSIIGHHEGRPCLRLEPTHGKVELTAGEGDRNLVIDFGLLDPASPEAIILKCSVS